MVELINRIADHPDDTIHERLSDIDVWKWARSDLNAWIKVLNKFDAILEKVIIDYNVDTLQLQPFDTQTKRIVMEILRFEKLLLENSTNRKMFNSYDVRHTEPISFWSILTVIFF